MAIQAPLNSMITDPFQGGPNPIENLESDIGWQKIKGYSLWTIEKVCYVAIAAIIVGILATAYTSTAVASPALLAAVALSTPIFAIIAAKVKVCVDRAFKELEFECAVLLKMNVMRDWTAAHIQQYLEAEDIQIAPILRHAKLSEISPNRPILALKPLIARYQHIKELSSQILESALSMQERLEESFAQKEEQSGQIIPTEEKQNIRITNREIAQVHIERHALPLALQAATIHRILARPSANLNVNPFEFHIDGVGACTPRSLLQRMYGRHEEPNNDNFFVFLPALQRAPLTLAQVMENAEPKELTKLLYPRAVS